MTHLPIVPLVVNGCTIFAPPLFLDQVEAVIKQVEGHRHNAPVGYVPKNAGKRLAAIAKLAFEAIPQDPARSEYRDCNTLGEEHKHWFRTKFFGNTDCSAGCWKASPPPYESLRRTSGDFMKHPGTNRRNIQVHRLS